MSSDRLVLCSGTLDRDVPFETVVQAAHAADFWGISLWGREYASARAAGLSDADMRLILDDNDICIAYLDPAWWWLPGAGDVVIPPEADDLELFSFRERDMFAIANAVGASSILAIDAFGGAWDAEEAAEFFGAFCDRGAEVGLDVHLEFLPWSRINDLATAWEIVRLADRENSGIALDAWHWYRSRPDMELLASLPSERITTVILDDGPATPETDLLQAAMHERLLPGTGELPLTELVAAVRASIATAPVGVEVLSDEFHRRDPFEAARLAALASRGVLASAART